MHSLNTSYYCHFHYLRSSFPCFQVLYEPVYDTLRTKQQLGYSVSSGARLTHGVCGFCVVVVSPAFSAAEVEGRIENFLQDFAGTLQVRGQGAKCSLSVYGVEHLQR